MIIQVFDHKEKLKKMFEVVKGVLKKSNPVHPIYKKVC